MSGNLFTGDAGDIKSFCKHDNVVHKWIFNCFQDSSNAVGSREDSRFCLIHADSFSILSDN